MLHKNRYYDIGRACPSCGRNELFAAYDKEYGVDGAWEVLCNRCEWEAPVMYADDELERLYYVDPEKFDPTYDLPF